MSDEHPHFDAETGPWPLGWAVAFGAGAVAAVLAGGVGGADSTAALVIGAVSFAVFGVLLGAGGVERTTPAEGEHDHSHDHSNGGHH